MDKYLRSLKGFHLIGAFLVMMALLQGVAIIFQAKYLAIVITNLFNGEKLSEQLLPILFFCLCYLSRQLIITFRERRMSTFASKAGADVRQRFMQKLFQSGPVLTEMLGTGHLVTMALEGVSQMETYIKLAVPKVVNMVVIPCMIVVYTCTIDVQSAIVLLLVLPTLLFFMVILGMAAKRKASKQYESYQTLSNHFVDSLRGLETLRLLGLSKRYERNIEQVSERYRKSTMDTLKFAFLSTFALDFFSSLSVAIVALFLGLSLINGELVLLPALTTLILAPEYFLPIREFGNDYHATLDGKNAWTAMNTIITTAEDGRGEPISIPTWNAESELIVQNMTVLHEGANRNSLNQIHFSWKGYGRIGIIGASGSGKSTLIQVLSGFLNPTSASISINGIHVHHFCERSWQDQLHYIPQHPYIFNKTVAENIAFYVPQASRNAIEKACERAGLTEVVASLPLGLDEPIGEKGRLLSGGQEQRLALARAFLEDERKILLLDEPTAHLDIETEWELKQRILPLFNNRLVFFATHRLHWMKEMDHILVLNHGEIVEHGTHEELVQMKGYYYQLMLAQMSGGEINE
ncbi:MAG: thiol reductant ABC exporter subunit CydD [Bacillus sp. (in: firmicutes)]